MTLFPVYPMLNFPFFFWPPHRYPQFSESAIVSIPVSSQLNCQHPRLAAQISVPDLQVRRLQLSVSNAQFLGSHPQIPSFTAPHPQAPGFSSPSPALASATDPQIPLCLPQYPAPSCQFTILSGQFPVCNPQSPVISSHSPAFSSQSPVPSSLSPVFSSE